MAEKPGRTCPGLQSQRTRHREAPLPGPQAQHSQPWAIANPSKDSLMPPLPCNVVGPSEDQSSPVNSDVRLFRSGSLLTHETVKKYPAPLAAVSVKVDPPVLPCAYRQSVHSFTHTQRGGKAAGRRAATLPCKSPLAVQLGASRCSCSGAMLLGRPWGRCNPGRCACLLILALLVDAVGLVLLLVGIFAPLDYWDFFVYSGALILAFSLLFWIIWYSLNIELSLEKLDL